MCGKLGHALFNITEKDKANLNKWYLKGYSNRKYKEQLHKQNAQNKLNIHFKCKYTDLIPFPVCV